MSRLWMLFACLFLAASACGDDSSSPTDTGGDEGTEADADVPTDTPIDTPIDTPEDEYSEAEADGGCPAECDDGNECNGLETCNVATGLCEPGTPPATGTPCDLTGTDDGICRGEVCVSTSCGDGITDPGEDCDDGDYNNGDGCDNDCTFSCTTGTDCDDGEVCNGTETCDTGTHACAPGTPPDDGTACELPEGGSGQCRAGLCVSGSCGNGSVDTGEECDDGNTDEMDGCRTDCTYTCSSDGTCNDGLTCNGVETCDTATHTCTDGLPSADGDICELDGDPATRDICVAQTCQLSVCGDGFADTGASPAEECDDGGLVSGDGCEADCTFSCTETAECDDGDPCDGAESCNDTTHVCESTDPPDDGTACDADGTPTTRDICLSESCGASVCGDAYVDSGTSPPEQCEDGNTVFGDGCDPDDCRYSCVAALDCSDGNTCNGVETCNTTTHVCLPGTPPADGTACTLPGGGAGECRAGECITAGCGNGVVGAGEECDDGNYVSGDGCEPDCQFSCDVAADCNDSEFCTTDACVANLNGQICQNTALADGTACTLNCFTASACTSGVCTGVTPLDCDDDNPCTSDFCSLVTGNCRHFGAGNPAYADADSDGYGAGAYDCVGRLPAGWSWTAGDCCDSFADANPGQTGWFTVPYACGSAGSFWDYNCSGATERRYPSVGVCALLSPGRCNFSAGWLGSIPECGAEARFITNCRPDLTGARCVTETSTRTQGCH
ncbi:MAG: hypothetical protein JXB32_02755 [Deltaproteobacteria bacterium]|nr:hypothetical protein [Deltaproteobacteria bacterium]